MSVVEFHELIGIHMEFRARVVTKVDAIVEAHQEGIGISGTLLSICAFSCVQGINYIFPMTPDLELTSAGARDEIEDKTYVNR
jgi:hypothetical protein